MTPKPVRHGYFYENGYRRTGTEHWRRIAASQQDRQTEIRVAKSQFDLEESTPDYVFRDILLENSFTEYAELLFPETVTT